MPKSEKKRPASDSSSEPGGPPADDLPVQRDDQAPDDEQIRTRAYEIYLRRGDADGGEMEDWLEAEREYRERSGSPQQGGETRQEPPGE